eukprot:800068-Pelagomonas_calceolata.AAC.1
MPSQCATLGTASVIPPMTMKSCFNSCAMRSIPPFKPIHRFILLPHWRGSSGNAYMNWISNYPGYVRVLAKFHARCI